MQILHLHFIQYSFLKCVNLISMWHNCGFIIQRELAVQFCKKFCLTGWNKFCKCSSTHQIDGDWNIHEERRKQGRSLMLCLQHIHTCFKNLGLTWMLALALTVGGSGLMGQAGSTELTRTSSAYSFLRGNTSSHVDRNLNRLFLVFSSTYKQRTWLGPTATNKNLKHFRITAAAKYKHYVNYSWKDENIL